MDCAAATSWISNMLSAKMIICNSGHALLTYNGIAGTLEYLLRFDRPSQGYATSPAAHENKYGPLPGWPNNLVTSHM